MPMTVDSPGLRHTARVASTVQQHRLVLVSGEEGAGKSTIVRALLPHTPNSARIDAEDLGQTNPCPMDNEFFDLLRRNVAGLVENFWTAGYTNVIAGSFLRDYPDYLAFRKLLTLPRAVFLVDLIVDKDVRDGRRVTRAKQTTQEWRDMVDRTPEDLTIRQATDADYRYVGIDTTRLDTLETVRRIKHAIPEIYAR
jgi:ABC-type cobalamin/Fe3+-siderophores transport system ATPase subunit